MPRPTKLLPGQEVTVAEFNAEIDRTRKQLSGATGSTIQAGSTGGGLTPMRGVEPVWGRLTEPGPEKSPDYFQWEEVYPDKDGKWTARTGDADTEKAPHDSVILTDADDEEWLINPAVEVNDRKPPVGTVVRLFPTEHFVEEEKALEDDRDDYWFHRHWLFTWGDESLRPFVLRQDSIPARATGPGDNTPIYDTSVSAEWLDSPGELVTLYSAHRTGWPFGDSFISLGYGRGPSAFSRGTYGWARYIPRATQTGVDDDGEAEWRGEWQIVELYAELIQEMEVIGSNVVETATKGQASLWWPDDADGKVRDSGYDIVFYNDLFHDLAPDDFIQCRYDRYTGLWIAFGYPIPSGVTLYQSAGQESDSTYKTLLLGTEMDGTRIGLHIEEGNSSIKNTSEKDIIGHASWAVCAQRRLDPLPINPGPDAAFQCALFNDGTLVVGTESRSTSSRRRDATGSAKAVNTNSGSVIVKIEAGKELEIRIRHLFPIDGNDIFTTVADHSHFTFVEIQGARDRDSL